MTKKVVSVPLDQQMWEKESSDFLDRVPEQLNPILIEKV
jgi:hypothetical protein